MASGFIPLGHRHLRPLHDIYMLWVSQTSLHHYVDQTNSPCQPTPALAGPIFSHPRIPIRPFQADFTIYTDTSTQGWGAHMGDSQIFVCLDPFRLQASHQLFGTQSSNFCPMPPGYSASGPPGYDRYRQHYIPTAYPVASRSGCGSNLTTLSSGPGTPSVSTKSAKNDRVESPPLYLWDMGNSNSGHVCHSLQRPSSPVYVSQH